MHMADHLKQPKHTTNCTFSISKFYRRGKKREILQRNMSDQDRSRSRSPMRRDEDDRPRSPPPADMADEQEQIKAFVGGIPWKMEDPDLKDCAFEWSCNKRVSRLRDRDLHGGLFFRVKRTCFLLYFPSLEINSNITGLMTSRFICFCSVPRVRPTGCRRDERQVLREKQRVWLCLLQR